MLIHHLYIRNLLSFGDRGLALGLQPLNVLAGPNGSGKSNVLEAISLLRATGSDIQMALSKGGRMMDWVWQGNPEGEVRLEAILDNHAHGKDLRHVFAFQKQGYGIELLDERIEYESPYPGKDDVYFFYRWLNGRPVLNTAEGGSRQLRRETVERGKSIIAQFQDPEVYPELDFLSRSYGAIRLYRDWTIGRNSIFRQPQPADQRNDHLAEDFSNLGLFLNKLGRSPATKRALIEALQDLYQELDGYEVIIEGGSVQVFFTEGEFSIPATRLSDGTLRYLALLAILLDPTPPPLIGLEEPELGLHPDLIPKVADLLMTASERTQLVVTTHSDILIDALTEQPESVLICEKHEGQTQIERLDREALGDWLARYRLGALWINGEIGGKRW